MIHGIEEGDVMRTDGGVRCGQSQGRGCLL